MRRLGDLVLIAAVVVGVGLWQTRSVPSGPAPAFDARLHDGSRTSLAGWRAGHAQQRAMVVYFWAEWCPICRASEGMVNALRRDWPVLTVAMQSGEADRVAALLAERALAWPAVVDADGSIAARYGLRGVPAYIVLDRHGEIRFAETGYTTGPGLRLRLWWADTFAGGSAFAALR
jgi:thiol-disulfide isomerase/thioredoxin